MLILLMLLLLLHHSEEFLVIEVPAVNYLLLFLSIFHAVLSHNTFLFLVVFLPVQHQLLIINEYIPILVHHSAQLLYELLSMPLLNSTLDLPVELVFVGVLQQLVDVGLVLIFAVHYLVSTATAVAIL